MIKVYIDKKGGFKIDVEGVSGKKCKELTSNIERALGKVTSETIKDEYFEEKVYATDQNIQEG